MIMVRPTAFLLLLAATALHAGCGTGASSLLTTSSLSTGAPGSTGTDQSVARSTYAARIAAGAKRCGFSQNPDMLWGAYRAYEAQQGTTQEQLVKVENSYQAGLRSENEKILVDADYCSARKVAEIKSALQRQGAGDYTPVVVKAADSNCGFFGCPIPLQPEKPFDAGKFWAERLKDPDQAR